MWILFFIGFILFLSFAYAANAGAPWVPTWKKDLSRIQTLASLKPGETFMELGCGNARVSRFMAKAVPDANIIGVDLSIFQVMLAKLQAVLGRQKNVEIRFGNAFAQDLTHINVVHIFLMPETYEKIRPKLESELRPGARVMTYVWPIPGWEPTHIDHVEGSQKFYLYHI